jgi:hypothetical protein
MVEGLEELKLPVLENKGDQLTAQLESRFADDRHVWIEIHRLPEEKSRVTIRVGLLGDELLSRKLMEAMKRHLPVTPQPST